MAAPPLPELTTALDRALKVGDPDQIREARRALAGAYPDSEPGAEASFRLGLDTLFSTGDLDASAELFRAATKAKSAKAAMNARTSLGIVLLRQGKHQQAVFELRKVGAQKPPSLTAAQAMSLVAASFRQQRNGAEVERARGEQIKILEAVAKDPDPAIAGIAEVLLGAEHKADGRRDQAKQRLEAALARKALPAEYQAKARELLAAL